MKNTFLSLFFPPRCAFCSKVTKNEFSICDDCIKLLPYIKGKTCSVCGKPIPEFSHHVCYECKSEKKYFTRTFVPLEYTGIAKKGMVRMKYHHHPSYAKAFAFLIAKIILADTTSSLDFDFITYVPQNSITALARGFNQSELIAKHLSSLLNIPCNPTLIRTNNGKRQATLNRTQRRANVRKCYFKGSTQINGTVLLVDDVYTTGATANYCARLLKSMGADMVYLAVAMIRGYD